MFSYYGSKTNLVGLYPPPVHDLIIEPFAGAGKYALKYFERDVILMDISPDIIKIWNYLKEASVRDIMRLPKPLAGVQKNRDMFSCDGEFLLYRFMIVQGSASGNDTPSSWTIPKFEKNRRAIARSLYKIRHWQFKLGGYRDLENIVATWFIDPPYEFGGHRYKFNNKKIDYGDLAAYCKERKGQIIVCENTKATWLDFKPMKDARGSMFRTTEAIYTNAPSNYDNVQQKLFI